MIETNTTNDEITITIISKENEDCFELLLPALPTGDTFAVGAICDDLPVGASLIRFDENSFHILSIYVITQYQRRGVGSRLIEMIFNFASDNNVDSIFAAGEFSKASHYFLEKNGFAVTYDLVKSFEVKSISRGDALKNRIKSFMEKIRKYKVVNLRDLNEYYDLGTLQKYTRTMRLKGISPTSIIQKNYYDKFSFAVLREDNSIQALLLSSIGTSKSDVIVTALVSDDNPMDLLALFMYFMRDVIPAIGLNGRVSFVSADDRIEKVIDKILGDKIIISKPYIYAGRMV